MKTIFKSILLAILGLSSTKTLAQLPDGTVAPDFTLTDITGNTHVLSEYLAADKIVILDIYNTLCSPCWYAHIHHYMEDLYNTYGPEGTDEIMVLSLEGSAYTNSLEDMYGTSTMTIGDWTKGISFPQFYGSDAEDITDDEYAVTGFPQFYKICPDGTGSGLVYDVPFSNQWAWVAHLNSCGPGISEINNHVKVMNAEYHLCNTNVGEVFFEFENLGDNSISTASFELLQDGEIVAEKSYSGSISKWGRVEIVFPEIELDPSASYSIKTIEVNETTPFNPGLASGSLDVIDVTNIAETEEIAVKITLDHYAETISWEIKNAAGDVILESPIYENLPEGDEWVWTEVQDPIYVTLNPNECYTFSIYDEAGDGFTQQKGNYLLEDGYGNILAQGGTATFEYAHTDYFKTGSFSGLDEANYEISIFPNPFDNTLYISNQSSHGTVSHLIIRDLQGRILFTENQVQGGQHQVDLSFLSSGTYLLEIWDNKSVGQIVKIIKT